MGRGVAGQAFHRPGVVDDPLCFGAGFIKLPELGGFLHGLVQGHPQFRGDQLGDPVHVAVGKVKGPAYVADCPTGQHCAKGNDLGHMVFPVPFLYIVDDLSPAEIAEVHVYIRHGYPLRVKEPFKEEGVAQGVNIGNAQGVGHDGTGGRAAAGAYSDPPFSGVVYEIPDDEEVAVKAHPVDNIQLIFQPLPHFLCHGIIPAGDFFLTKLP